MNSTPGLYPLRGKQYPCPDNNNNKKCLQIIANVLLAESTWPKRHSDTDIVTPSTVQASWGRWPWLCSKG